MKSQDPFASLTLARINFLEEEQFMREVRTDRFVITPNTQEGSTP